MSAKELKGTGFNGLRILCILSVIGFVYSMANDSVNYYTYANNEELSKTNDSKLKEQIDDKMSYFNENGVDVTKEGLEKISWLYLGRSIIDVLALLGVTLMFYKLKIGFNIYVIFQICYVVIPFVIIGNKASVIIPYKEMVITMVYVALFVTQRKHLV